MIIEAYKVVGVTNNERHSAFFGTASYGEPVPWVVYIPNQVTVFPKGCGPLACYKTKEQAVKKARDEFIFYNDIVEVWRAEILKSKETSLWYKLLPETCPWDLESRMGEIAADTVKLVELLVRTTYGDRTRRRYRPTVGG